MKQRAIGKFVHPLQLFLQDHPIKIRLAPGVYDEFDQGTGLSDSLAGIVKLTHVKAHHLACQVSHVAARIRVVAHVNHSIAGQVLLANCEKSIAHRLWDPGVYSMSNDEIEASQVLANVQDIELSELDILEAKVARALLPFLDSCCSEIYPNALCFRQTQCHRRQIETIVAAELQHSRAIDLRRFHSKERSDSRQPIRVSVRQGVTGIRYHVIRGCLNAQLVGSLKPSTSPN